MKRALVVAVSGLGLFCAAVAVEAMTRQQSNVEEAPEQLVARSCPSRTLLMNWEIARHGEPVRQMPIWQLPQSQAFFFVAGMSIDADGAPSTAYNADNTGLDDLENAGHPGALGRYSSADESGNPFVQGINDPFPGFCYFVHRRSPPTEQKNISILDPFRGCRENSLHRPAGRYFERHRRAARRFRGSNELAKWSVILRDFRGYRYIRRRFSRAR